MAQDRGAARVLGRRRKSPTSAEVPPVIRTSSSKDVGNTVCGCPAAAHTTSYFASQTSTSVRIGAGCPTGPTPPITCPVQARTDRASARDTTAAPTREATREVSTRCAPLVITSSGSPSAANTRLFAIAPTSQPSCAAAAAAVEADSGSTCTGPATPRSRSTLANREKSTAAIPPSYRSPPPEGQSNYPERIRLTSPAVTGSLAGARPSLLPRQAGAARTSTPSRTAPRNQTRRAPRPPSAPPAGGTPP